MAQICRFFQQGRCTYGANCRFLHNTASGSNSYGNHHAQGNGYGNHGTFPAAQAQGRPGGNYIAPTPAQIEIDLVERPMWILSSYAPGKDAPAQLIDGKDISFEEARLMAYQCFSTGNGAAYEAEFTKMTNEAEGQMRNILGDLPGAVAFMKNAYENRANSRYASQSDGESGNAPSTFENQPQPTSAFGQPQPPTSAFGQPQQQLSAFQQASPSPFGQPQQPTSAFGNPSALGQRPTPAFGQSGFSQLPKPAFGQPAFGQSAFGQTSTLGQPTSAFGQPAATPAASPFGQQNNQQASSAFGSQSAFGATPGPKPAFGQPAFGQPAFGQPAVLGNNNASRFAGPPSTSAFGIPGQQQQNVPGLNNFSVVSQPQQSPPSASPFGISAQQQSGPGLNNYTVLPQPQQSLQSAFGQPVGQSPPQNTFGQPVAQPSPFSNANPFQQSQQAPNPFGQSQPVQQTPNPAFGQPSQPVSAFANPPPLQQQASSPFSQTNPFQSAQQISPAQGQQQQQQGQERRKSIVGGYPKTNKWEDPVVEYTDAEKAAFAAPCFKLGQVPEVAPSREMCWGY